MVKIDTGHLSFWALSGSHLKMHFYYWMKKKYLPSKVVLTARCSPVPWSAWEQAQRLTQCVTKLCFCYRLKSEVPTENDWRKKPEQGEHNQCFLVYASRVFSCLMTVLMKCISQYQSLFSGILTNIISDAVSLLESAGFFSFSCFFLLKAGICYWLQKNKCSLGLILLLSACTLSPFQSRFRVRDFDFQLPHPRKSMELAVRSALRGASLLAGAGLNCTKSVICKGAKARFSCESILGGEDLCSDKDREVLHCTPVRGTGRTSRGRAEVCSPGNPDTDSMSLRGFFMLQNHCFLFSDGFLEGRNKKEVSDLKASLIILSV